MTMPITGGTITTLATGSFTPLPPWIAADASGVFWTLPGSGNGVKDGAEMTWSEGKATAISSEQPGPEGIALDAGHLYWANCGGRTAAAGTIMRKGR
jgi:hypothetical protein